MSVNLQKDATHHHAHRLSGDGVIHYQKIIKALERTNHWMQELDTHHDH